MEGIQDEKVSNPQYDSNVKPDLDLLLANWELELGREKVFYRAVLQSTPTTQHQLVRV